MNEVLTKTVIALIAFSDGELSMYKGEIRDIDETKAEQLISDGYVEEYSGGSGGVLAVNAVLNDDDGTWTLDKTWQEIHDAFVSGSVRIAWEDDFGTEFVLTVNATESGNEMQSWIIYTPSTGNWAPGPFVTDSADGYPMSES